MDRPSPHAETSSLADAEQLRARLADVLEHAPAFIAVVRGPRHVLDHTNELYRQLIGHREVLGKPLAEALPEVVEQGFVALLDQVYATGKPFVGNNTHALLQREPGRPLEERVVDFIFQPLSGPDGTVTGVLIHGIDLTERVRTERQRDRLADELRQQAQTFDATLSHINDCAYTFDLAGRFTFANQATLTLWGRTLDQVVGKTLADIGYTPQAVAKIDAERREVIATGRPTTGETYVKNAAGEPPGCSNTSLPRSSARGTPWWR